MPGEDYDPVFFDSGIRTIYGRSTVGYVSPLAHTHIIHINLPAGPPNHHQWRPSSRKRDAHKNPDKFVEIRLLVSVGEFPISIECRPVYRLFLGPWFGLCYLVFLFLFFITPL